MYVYVEIGSSRTTTMSSDYCGAFSKYFKGDKLIYDEGVL